MKTQQLIDRLHSSHHMHLQRLGQCIRDAVRREDWAAVIALAKIARKVQGGAA
jgi:hypothetical protein